MYVYTIHVYNIIVCYNGNTKDLTEFSYSLIGSRLNGHLEWIVTADRQATITAIQCRDTDSHADKCDIIYHPVANEGGLYLVV